jgi:hypothetical protein
MKPPETIDGARVVYWAWSTEPPLFLMQGDPQPEAVCGLAVCEYASGAVYRFSCDAQWQVLNDSPYPTVLAALTARSGNYDVTRVAWVRA